MWRTRRRCSWGERQVLALVDSALAAGGVARWYDVKSIGVEGYPSGEGIFDDVVFVR